MSTNDCSLKYPLLMVHGMGFRDRKHLCYWGRIPKALESHGANVFFGHQDAVGSVEGNALTVAKSLDEELKADEKKAEIKNGSGNGNESENGSGNGNGGGYRKPRNNNYNRSDSNRNSSNRGSGNSGRKKPEGSKNDGGSGKNDGVKKEGGKREGGSGRSGGNGGPRRSNNRKPADKPKLEDATKTKADDGFEVVIAEPESKE